MRDHSLDQVTLRRRGAGLIASNPHRSAGGYTLFAPQTGNGAVYLIDIDGAVVHQWNMPHRPGRDAVLLANGNLGYNGSHPDSPDIYPAWPLWHGGAFREVTPAGDVVWAHDDMAHHHDARWLANGNLLYTTAEPVPRDFAARIQGGSSQHDLPDGTIFGDVVKEVNRQGEIVWLWRSWEHLDPAAYPIHPFFDRYHWPLINSVAPTRDGLVLMSLRTTSGVVAINKASGDIAWEIGHDMLAQQHAPEELPNGNFIVFDNGNFRPGISTPYSRVVEIDPRSKTIAWEYTDEMRPAFFSAYMGGAQRLANGNTFITESSFGRLFEVTPDSEVVWEYVIPYFAEYPEPARKFILGHHNSVFRAHRYLKSEVPWL